MKIDINSDMGEGFGRYTVADDAALMDVVSSVNVACGFHAGDPTRMANTVKTAKAKGLGLGAHPGLPDLMGFGRRNMAIGAAEMENLLIYQLGALQGFAGGRGLSGDACELPRRVREHGNGGPGPGGCPDRGDQGDRQGPGGLFHARYQVEHSARAAGLRTMQLFLADRAYRGDGSLVPRGLPGAVFHSSDEVAERVKRFIETGTVVTIDGATIPMRARAILIHSDTPGSAVLAATVRRTVEAAGATIAPAHTFAE